MFRRYEAVLPVSTQILLTNPARVFAVAQRAVELAADAALLGDPCKAKKAVKKVVRHAWDVFTASDDVDMPLLTGHFL